MEKINPTKECIIYESLNLFSQKGYNGVSMRDIAAAVGIKGASIYNHFKGKEEIFTAIFSEMTNRYETISNSLAVPQGDINEITHTYMEITEANLQLMAQGLFSFFMVDEFASKFRKMLIGEQYKNKLARDTLNNYFFDMPIKYQTELFDNMIKQGAFGAFDPHIMAMHFYSPIYFLLMQNDIINDPEQSLQLIQRHVHQFSKIYH
jgi:Transcriptional regulator